MASDNILASHKITKTVVAAGAATRGYLLELAAGGTVNNCTTAASGFYVALNTAAAGAKVDCAAPGAGLVKVMIGTGGATAGTMAMWAAANDGFTNAPAVADGDNVTITYGVWEDGGAAGEFGTLWFRGRGAQENA